MSLHAPLGLCECGVYISDYMLLCVYIQNCVHLYGSVWMHICICVDMRWSLLGHWVMHSYLCKHMSLAVAERMYDLWDDDTPVGLCQCEYLWHYACVCVFLCVGTYLWWMLCMLMWLLYWRKILSSFLQLSFYCSARRGGSRFSSCSWNSHNK